MAEHPPRTNEPDYSDALSRNAVVRDAETGSEQPAEAWIEAHMERERRTREECVEALVNAVARGDLVVVDDGTE